ncbi:MAG: sigma-70 family RNA polymerase sigma factor [Phycisphaerae bacterium]|nr:sigma-70 family RNA polymerase sigma factor [Phycisphaerae bacterium]
MDSLSKKSIFCCGYPDPSGTNTVEPALKKDNVTAGGKRSNRSVDLPATHGARAPGSDSDPSDIAGETESLVDALERNAQGLWRFLWVRVGGDENLAEDLMQELCLQATRTYASARSARHIDAWLFGVARNVLRRHWRTITRRRRNLPEARVDVATELAGMLDSIPLPNDHIERNEVKEQVLLAVSSLPTDDQNLILRCYFDGQTQADIAADLGVSVRAVEGRLYRARLALRERLQHLDDEVR